MRSVPLFYAEKHQPPACEKNRWLISRFYEILDICFAGEHTAGLKELLFDCKRAACAVSIRSVDAAEPECDLIFIAGQLHERIRKLFMCFFGDAEALQR